MFEKTDDLDQDLWNSRKMFVNPKKSKVYG